MILCSLQTPRSPSSIILYYVTLPKRSMKLGLLRFHFIRRLKILRKTILDKLNVLEAALIDLPSRSLDGIRSVPLSSRFYPLQQHPKNFASQLSTPLVFYVQEKANSFIFISFSILPRDVSPVHLPRPQEGKTPGHHPSYTLFACIRGCVTRVRTTRYHRFTKTCLTRVL